MATIEKEVQENEEDRNAAKEHNEKEIKKLESGKATDDIEKTDLEAVSAKILNGNDQLLDQIETQIKQWTELEIKQNLLYKEQLEQRKGLIETIASEMKTVDEIKIDLIQLEREQEYHNQTKTELEGEQKQLQDELDQIQQEDGENTSRQNYLQMSLKTLREEIVRIQKELKENEALLEGEIQAQQTLKNKIEELRLIIEKAEERIKTIEREIAFNEEEARKLELERKNLEKEVEQMKTAIDRLNTMLEAKKHELVQLQTQVDTSRDTVEKLKEEVMNLQALIQIDNDKLIQMNSDLTTAEQRLKEFDDQRKALEEKQREYETTSQNLDNTLVDKRNQLTRLEQKLTAATEIYDRSRRLVQQLTEKQIELNEEVEKLKNEEQALTIEVARLTTETQLSLDQKNDAVKNEKDAETVYQEAQRTLNQLKQQECEKKSEYEREKNNEERARIQLQEALHDQRIAESELIAARAEVDSNNSHKILWRIIGMIPTLSHLASDKKQEIDKAEMALQRAMEKVEAKRLKVLDLRDKLIGVEYRVGDSGRQHTAKKDALQAQETATRKAKLALDGRKSTVEQMTEQHREAIRRQKQCESNLRLTTTQFQRTEAQLNTANSELERRQEQMNTHRSQKEDITVTIEGVNTDITRHKIEIEGHQQVKDTHLKHMEQNEKEHQEHSIFVQKLKDGGKLLKDTIGTRSNTVKANEREITHEQTLYNAKKLTVDELKNDIKNRGETLTNIKNQLDNKTIELSTKKKVINDKNGLKTTLESEVKEFKKEKANKEVELRNGHSQVLAQKNKAKLLEQEFDLLNQRDKQLCTNIEIVDDKLKQKKERTEKNTNKLTEINKTLNGKRARQADGENIINTSNDILKHLDDRITESNNSIRQREMECEKLSDQVTQANVSLSTNEILKGKRCEKIEELGRSITAFKVSHYQQQSEYCQKSSRSLENHPQVVKIRNEAAHQNINLQNRTTAN